MLSFFRSQLNEAQDEIMKKKELLEDLQPDNTQTCGFKCSFLLLFFCYSITHETNLVSCASALRVDELMAALKKKDDDMRAMEERYKMYLEKARNVSCMNMPLITLTRSDWIKGANIFLHLSFWLAGNTSFGPQAESCHC